MAQSTQQSTVGSPTTKQKWQAGLSLAAAAIMVSIGLIELLQGASAVNKDAIFVGPQYIYKLDLTAWGAIHMIVGAVLILTGVALFFGATAARGIAIVILAVTVVINFLWIPYYPAWSITVVALSIVAIWAVASWDTSAI